MSEVYRIAEVAEAAGVAAGTLRLWEFHGLITPERSEAGQRRYSSVTLERARQIAEMRNKQGLSLAQIADSLGGPKVEDPKRSRSGKQAPLPPGPRIREIRSKKGLSITDVANALGVSASLISTFERTSNGVSVTMLKRIADYFNITITSLTFPADPEVPGPVRKAGKQRPPAHLSPGVDVRALATGHNMMDVKEWKLEPGATSEGSYNHEGEEFVYVLSGRFEISVEGRGTMTLSAGDSLYFESSRRHSWTNKSEKLCTVLWINTGSF